MSSAAIIPRPSVARELEGAFTLRENSRIFTLGHFRAEAEFLRQRFHAATGYLLEIIAQSGIRPGLSDIALEAEPSDLITGPEAYRLSFPWGQGLTLQARTQAGMARALQTLLQLFPPAIYSNGPRINVAWTFDRVEIEDAPRYGWRGAMLDCARHFMPPSFVKKFIDLLAMHKLNRFHWHLTDDQGWRIEIERFPKLTQVGSIRKETLQGHLHVDGTGDGIPHGGFYTKSEVREIVRYAAERHITIVPEIEMPGHAQAALASYPEFGCTSEAPDVLTSWGISPFLYHPVRAVRDFLYPVLEEVIALFPGQYVHIGGDEAIKTQWTAHSEIQSLIKTAGDAEALQGEFVQGMADFLRARGKTMIGWDEILNSKRLHNVTAMIWRDLKIARSALEEGNSVVLAPADFTYFDYYQSRDVSAEPLAIGGLLPLEKVYRYEPELTGLSKEQKSRILGVQGQIWTEYIPTPQHVEYMAFPRLSALSEVAWSSPQSRSFPDFSARLDVHLQRLRVSGVNYRRPT